MRHLNHKQQVEFGDFQTPDYLAQVICKRLKAMGIQPSVVVEPTCGIGAFVLASAEYFPQATIYGFEINSDYLTLLKNRIQIYSNRQKIQLHEADFFTHHWLPLIEQTQGSLLVLGNFPWVTNAVLGGIRSSNLPRKVNFQNHQGLDAITGKANFDISEWMLLETCRWLNKRQGVIAMLVKTNVARKVLVQAKNQSLTIISSAIFKIDAKQAFQVAVEACLLVIHFDAKAVFNGEYYIFDSLEALNGQRIGHRMGLSIANLDQFEQYCFLVGSSPQKWRSGIKHDAAAVMELTEQTGVLVNGYGDKVDIEPDYLFPLMKGSDIGSAKKWRNKYLLVTQRYVGEPTSTIRTQAPKTWKYLQKHIETLNARASSIYLKKPLFSVFGIGDYAFRPWRIAICGLYKNLNFQLVAPQHSKPIMFDDTVYYLSFDTEQAARSVLVALHSQAIQQLLTSLIFWDEKRPIKASLLNLLDWSSLLQSEANPRYQLALDIAFDKKDVL